MKLRTLLIISFLTMTAVMVSCSSGNNSKDSESVDENGPEYTSAYICPMHCPGSGSDQPGTCPTCGMEYQKNSSHEDHNATEGNSETEQSEADSLVDDINAVHHATHL